MYKAILFSIDGGWVTDYGGCKTKDEVWERLADRGSRWFFYPICFVVVDHPYTSVTHRIVSAPDELNELEGRTVDKVADWIENNDLSWLTD